MSTPRYSSTLEYVPLATCCSTNAVSDSGRDIFIRASATSLMRQIVDPVVDSDAVRQSRKPLVVTRVVGPLPGVAQIHVVADRHHDAALIVIDRAPVLGPSVLVLLVGTAAPQVLRAGHLETVVQIVNRMEDRIGVVDVDDLALRENFLDSLEEYLPLKCAVEIVHHQKSAAQEKFPELRRLLIGDRPMPDLHRVHRRPVVHIVGAVEIYHLLHGARVDAAQTPDALQKVAVGARVIGGPVGVAAAEAAINAGNAQPRASPFKRAVPIGRNREIAILAAGIFLEGPLRPQQTQRAEDYQHRYRGYYPTPWHLPNILLGFRPPRVAVEHMHHTQFREFGRR